MLSVTGVTFIPTDQSVLIQQLKCIFPDSLTHINAREQSNLKYPLTGGYIELDAWIPGHALCFEFQDAHHYVTTYYYHKTQNIIQKKDNTKRYIAHQNGLFLIEVPCWWDGSVESLVASIHFQRPDLLSASSRNPIPLNAPTGFFAAPRAPEVGELMLASFPMDSGFDLNAYSWWMGEKYDGIRCYWHPVRRNVYSRTKRQISLRENFTTSLPPIFIDSELWFGRGLYSNTYQLLQGNGEFVRWDLLRMIAFDVPSSDLQDLPFEKRYRHLIGHISRGHSFVIHATRMLCKTHQQLRKSIQSIIDDGGEGAIMRKLGSAYEPGRSDSLIKLKATPGDREGIVLAIDDQRSVQIKLPNSTTFTVPSQNVHVQPISVGDIVTFSYENHSRREVPVNPNIYRIRTDLSWQDVVDGELKYNNHLTDLSMTSSKDFISNAIGHWSAKNTRLFLENFAKQRNMDPLLADTWYNMPYKAFHQFRSIFQKLRGYYKTLKYIFPEINFDNNRFPKSSWSDITERRNFFEMYAREAGFDPYNAEKWYSVQIKSMKGAKTIVKYHNNSIASALIDLFPNVQFDKSKFLRQSTWEDEEKRRHFFEEYAKLNNFDSLIPASWYSQPRKRILRVKGVSHVLKYHKRSLSRALLDLFPNIGLKKECLWTTTTKKRRVFENYAKANGFDPLKPENWYLQSRKRLLSFKGVREVIAFYGNRLVKTLMRLFPKIGLTKERFWNSGNSRAKRKEWFTNYAQVHFFDPYIPENWYSVDKEKFMATKGANDVLAHYKNNLGRALIDLFPEIGLDKSKFSYSPWHMTENRRKFFEQYASNNGFDPLKASNWYSLSREKIKSTPGAMQVISYHKYSVSRALVELFPEIPLLVDNFKVDKSLVLEKSPWYYVENRKRFFIDYANLNNFDALVPENWYLQSRMKIKSQKGAMQVLNYHNRSVATALVDLFPNIGLQKSKFKVIKHT